MEPFNLCCNFLRVVTDPKLSGLFLYFFVLGWVGLGFPFLFVLFFKLGKVLLHFIIAAWL